MIKPLVIKEILVDFYLNNVFYFTVNQFTQLDLRRQIAEQDISGFSMKINPQFWGLFDDEDNIENYVVNIDNNGEVTKWFPKYDLNDDYQFVSVFSETLSAVLGIRSAQKEKEDNKK